MTSLQNNITVIQESLNNIKNAIAHKSGIIVPDITSYSDNILNMFVGSNREISPQNVLQMPSTNFSFSLPNIANDIESYALQNSFYGCTSLTSVDLSSLTTISGSSSLYYAFSGCTSLTSVDLSSLTTISGSSSLSYAFINCTSLTNVDLSSLTTISGNSSLSYVFINCTSLTNVDLSLLTTISGSNALSGTFSDCTSLASLSFPSLTSTSFGSYTNQFNSMLSRVTGCTVHFPSNLQPIIGSWSSVISGFGGTNTTVLFDLPATT